MTEREEDHEAAREEPLPPPRPGRYTPKHLVLVALFSVVLAGAVNWPVVVHLTTDMPSSRWDLRTYSRSSSPAVRGRLGDPMHLAWEVSWDGHALTEQPARFFDGNILWPFPHSLAFSDALLGYTPAGLVGSGPRAALIRYNVLFLFSYALAFAGACLLATELGAGWTGGAVAGAAFAFNPWRLAQNAHLHVLSSGGIPLASFLLIRGWRNRSPGQLLAGWLVATWQLSIGFTLGVPFAYLLAVLVVVGVARWLAAGRPAVPTAAVAAIAVGALVLVGWSVLQASPYLGVVREFPGARRSLRAATLFSPPPSGYLAAPAESVAWGGPTRHLRDALPWPSEQTLFPGAVITLLALWGLVARRDRRSLRACLLAIVLVFGILALGFRLLHGDLGYRFLWLHAPGWDSTRTPGRVVTFALLALAILGGLGAEDLLRRVRARGRPARIRAAATGVLVGAIVFEGTGFLPHPSVPPIPPTLGAVRPPLLGLPTSQAFDDLYMYWSTQGFPEIVNANTSYTPCLLKQVRQRSLTFPDRRSVGLLRSIGVNSVVLDTELARGTPWARVASRPVDGLGIRRRRDGELIVFSLGRRPPDRSGLPLGPSGPSCHDRSSSAVPLVVSPAA